MARINVEVDTNGQYHLVKHYYTDDIAGITLLTDTEANCVQALKNYIKQSANTIICSYNDELQTVDSILTGTIQTTNSTQFSNS